MDLRKSCALAAGTLFLASAGIITVTTPAVAVPVPTTQVVASGDPWPSKAFRVGYREGREDGWEEARDECERPAKAKLHGLRSQAESDYMRGYEQGWERGYTEGFAEFCY